MLSHLIKTINMVINIRKVMEAIFHKPIHIIHKLFTGNINNLLTRKFLSP